MDQISETSEQPPAVEDFPKLTEQNVDNNLVQTILKEINNAQSVNSDTASASHASHASPICVGSLIAKRIAPLTAPRAKCIDSINGLHQADQLVTKFRRHSRKKFLP